MNEEELIKMIRSRKNMDLYVCENDFVKEFCKLAAFFNLQIVSFLLSKLCGEEQELDPKEITEMLIEVWDKNIEDTIHFASKSYTTEEKQERVKKMMTEARSLARQYIKNKLDIPPSAQDLDKMFKKM